MQGEEESVQRLLKDLDTGPSAAHVVKVDITDKDVNEGESKFEVR